MKKFASIFAAVILTVSVFMVSASAKLFTSDSLYEFDVGSDYGYWWLPVSGSDSPLSVLSVDVYSNGVLIYSFSAPSSVEFSRNSSDASDYPPYFLYWGDEAYPLKTGQNSSMSFHIVSENSSLTGHDSTLWGTAFSSPAVVSSVSGSVFDVGDSFLAFVQSSWLTLVVLGSFLVVLCLGVIRRLVKGV